MYIIRIEKHSNVKILDTTMYSQNGELKRCIESAHEKKKPIKCEVCDTAAFK